MSDATDKGRDFDLRPDPRILPMLGEINLPQWRCLAELVDNSIDAFLHAREAGSPSGWYRDALVRAEKAEAATREADARANTATVAAELMRARAEKAEAALDAEKAARIAEVAEFNAGYAAYMAKKPLAEAEAEYVASLPVTPEGYTPVSPPYDVFGFGYAWAAWDDLRCELKKAEAERDELRARLDAARGGAS